MFHIFFLIFPWKSNSILVFEAPAPHFLVLCFFFARNECIRGNGSGNRRSDDRMKGRKSRDIVTRFCAWKGTTFHRSIDGEYDSPIYSSLDQMYISYATILSLSLSLSPFLSSLSFFVARTHAYKHTCAWLHYIYIYMGVEIIVKNDELEREKGRIKRSGTLRKDLGIDKRNS